MISYGPYFEKGGLKRIINLVNTNHYLGLLYIELTIYFPIGRKRTANFRNQRL